MEYTHEDACCSWLSYAKFSSIKIQHMFAEFGSAESIHNAFVASGGTCLESYCTDSGFSMRELKKHAGEGEIAKMLDLMDKNEIAVITQESVNYPDNLRHIVDAPWLLFCRGNPACVNGKCVTIVGSRSASSNSLIAAEELAQQLSSAGIVIVSGLAAGIDSAAHSGCLKGKSPTAAVVACGLDTIYPAMNRDLAQRIIDSDGAIFSEQPVEVTATKWDFPYRNRIISGLSDGVVVMECGVKSGTMRTVEHALNQGKTVFAYPGIPGSVEAEGAHQLIREGATYFTKASDILEDLDWNDNTPENIARIQDHVEKAEEKIPDLNESESKVMDCLRKGCELSFDQLCSMTELEPSKLNITLTMLQLKGLVAPLPGKTYVRA